MNIKNIKLGKEELVAIGNGAKKIGKTIVIEGTKVVAVKSATAFITNGFENGLSSMKELKLDDYLAGGKNKNKPAKEKKERKKLFNFKKKTEEPVEEAVELVEEKIEVVKVQDTETNDTKPKAKNTK